MNKLGYYNWKEVENFAKEVPNIYRCPSQLVGKTFVRMGIGSLPPIAIKFKEDSAEVVDYKIIDNPRLLGDDLFPPMVGEIFALIAPKPEYLVLINFNANNFYRVDVLENYKLNLRLNNDPGSIIYLYEEDWLNKNDKDALRIM